MAEESVPVIGPAEPRPGGVPLINACRIRRAVVGLAGGDASPEVLRRVARGRAREEMAPGAPPVPSGRWPESSTVSISATASGDERLARPWLLDEAISVPAAPPPLHAAPASAP